MINKYTPSVLILVAVLFVFWISGGDLFTRSPELAFYWAVGLSLAAIVYGARHEQI